MLSVIPKDAFVLEKI